MSNILEKNTGAMVSMIGQLESLFSDDTDVGVLASILQSRSMQALLQVNNIVGLLI